MSKVKNIEYMNCTNNWYLVRCIPSGYKGAIDLMGYQIPLWTLGDLTFCIVCLVNVYVYAKLPIFNLFGNCTTWLALYSYMNLYINSKIYIFQNCQMETANEGNLLQTM